MNCVGVDLICYGTEEGGISRERNLSEVSVIRCIGGSEIGRWPVTDRPIIGMATRIVLSQTHEVLNTDTRPCRLQKYFLNFGQFSVPDVFTRFPDRSGWNWKSKSIKQLEYDFVVISIFQLVLVFDLFGRLLINNFALWSIMVQIWSGVFLQVVMVMVSQRWDGWWWCWWLPSSGTPSNVPARVVSYLGKDRHTHRAGLCKSSSPDACFWIVG